MNSLVDKKIKVGLVGCGRIAKNHFDAISKFPEEIELVGVCDTNSDRLAEATGSLGVEGYGTLKQMLQHCPADLIALCTPSGLHAEQTIAAAKAKKHVLTEKPMATRWNDALHMIRECDKHGVQLFVVKQNRLNSTIQMLKSAIDQGRFGKIYMVNINVFWNRPQDYYDQAPWRGTWDLDGGVLMNQASHYVDLIHYLFGSVESIHAFAGTLARKIEAEDTAVVNIKWRSGAVGSMNATVLTYKKNYEGSVTIIGEKGTVKLGGLAVNQIEKWEFDDGKDEDALLKQASYETTSVYGFGHPPYYKNVIDTLKGRAQPHTPGDEGLRSLEVIIAAYRSAKEGRPIGLPLEV